MSMQYLLVDGLEEEEKYQTTCRPGGEAAQDRERSNPRRYEGQDCPDMETRVDSLHFVVNSQKEKGLQTRTVLVLPKPPCDCPQESYEELIP
jgi:hypothetical protein